MPEKYDAEGIGYKETLNVISNDLDNNRLLRSDDPGAIKSLTEPLKYRQSRIAFAAVLFLIDDGEMEPKLALPFKVWKRPEINIEFDHKGTYKEMWGKMFLYEGGRV